LGVHHPSYGSHFAAFITPKALKQQGVFPGYQGIRLPDKSRDMEKFKLNITDSGVPPA
jgi:hypothetical protein